MNEELDNYSKEIGTFLSSRMEELINKRVDQRLNEIMTEAKILK